jgi:holo-[acyl-carrier protein] synthase
VSISCGKSAWKKSSKPVRFLTMAFAAKEACVKALGTGFKGVSYRDVGSIHEDSGKPVLVFSEKMQKRLGKLGIASSHVSLSDEGGLICAMVVLER